MRPTSKPHWYALNDCHDPVRPLMSLYLPALDTERPLSDHHRKSRPPSREVKLHSCGWHPEAICAHYTLVCYLPYSLAATFNMSLSEPKNANVRLLACLVDEDDTDSSDYRFLLDSQHVKYVITAPGTFRGAEDDRTFEPILLGSLFPCFPVGDWNRGHVAKDPETGEVGFVETEKV